MAAAEQHFGRPPDVFVANAGWYPECRLEDMALQQWRDVIDVNLTSAFLAIQASLPGMRRNGGGRIVLISSISGPVVRAQHAASCSQTCNVHADAAVSGLLVHADGPARLCSLCSRESRAAFRPMSVCRQRQQLLQQAAAPPLQLRPLVLQLVLLLCSPCCCPWYCRAPPRH